MEKLKEICKICFSNLKNIYKEYIKLVKKATDPETIKKCTEIKKDENDTKE